MGAEIFDLLMENDPDIVFVKDEAGTIVYANRAMLDLIAPSRRPYVVGSAMAEDFTAEEMRLVLEEDRRAFELGRSEIVERLVDWTGEEKVLQSRRIAFTARDGTRQLLVVATDITELSKRERSLVEAGQRLKRFSAFAAHDLRSPLATFVSALNVIKADEKTSLGPQSGEYVDLLIASAGNLAANVTAMLQSADVAHDTSATFAESDLNLLFEEVRFNLSSLVEATGATISAARLPNIVCDAGMMRQLLQNLVENSIKHRSAEPLHVTVRYERKGCRHRLFVEDNGVGIDGKAAATIFAPFERGGGLPGQGAGIGLTLCRRVVDIHAGLIRVDTSFSAGCRIEIVLPVDPYAAHDARSAA